jgi:hypothetical protein
MEKVGLQKIVRGTSTYRNVVDTAFKELIQPPIPTTVETDTVGKFFEMYEKLFFEIPAEGDINSHRYLVLRSTEYLGGNPMDTEKLALIEEINSLRQQLLELSDTYLVVNKTTF